MSRNRPAWKCWLAVFLLLVLFFQLAWGARQTSLTYDEPLYTAIGYADWTTRDVRWHGVIGHPPLVNLWTAWPLLLGGEHPDPRKAPGWGTDDSLGFSRALLGDLGPLERVTLVTRLPVMWLAIVLAALVYRWAQQAWGGWAGLLALGLFVFSPTVVAHAQLNTTDIGLTTFGFMGSYALARYLRHPTRAAYLGTGVGMGAALASKASGPFWVGVLGLVALAFWLTGDYGQKDGKSLLVWALRGAVWVVLALLVLWGAYLFELRPLAAGGVPVPAASHWAGLPYIRSYMATGQTTFLAGRLVSGGHWAYFPLALLVKTPLPMMLGLLAAALWSVRYGAGPRWSALPLMIIPIIYQMVAILMALNIGHRHMLPLLPFAYVFTGQLAGRRGPLRTVHVFRPGVRAVALGLLAVWYVAGTLAVAPHYLAYFNLLAGGPDKGYRYLADSSVDWGQGFKALGWYLEERGIERVRLAAFSSLDPALYGLDFEPLPPTVGAPPALASPFAPAPGVYVLSAVPLQGVWVLNPDTYDWFRHRQPVARVGHALFVYEVAAPEPTPSWVAQCAVPVSPLDAGQIAAGFGRSDLRSAVFDCRESWLYPAGGPGWTVLPPLAELDGWVEERLEGLPLSFHQRAFWNYPEFSVYAQRGTPPGSRPPAHAVRVPLGDSAPSDSVPVPVPVETAGPLSFMGYQVQPQADGIVLQTYWRVDQVPQRPLSLMAHLLTAQGELVAVGDGLGVPIEVWEPGDVIVQRHWLALPQDGVPETLWLQTGGYWLDTQERWLILSAGQPVGDRLVLPPLPVDSQG